MSEIILDEKKWAKEAIDSLSLGRKPFDTIMRVAKYYRSEGYTRGDLRRLVEQFMIRCDPTISLVGWDRSITTALAAAEKYPPVCISGVNVTDKEMERIKTLPGVLQQRLMFTLVCLAKFGNAVSGKNNNWVNRQQSEIFKLANINITHKRQSLMINDLWTAGMIEYSKLVDNTNLRVTIVEDGETSVTISDFRNIGNQYMMLFNDGYFKCEVCGLTLKKRSEKQRYCEKCAEEVNRASTKDRKLMKSMESKIFERFDFGGADFPD